MNRMDTLRERTEGHSASEKALVYGFSLIVVLVAGLLLANPAYAATTFTVNSTSDKGDQTPGDGKCFTGDVLVIGDECTLRAAIEEANAFAGADTINFDIPTTGVATISPGSELPTITKRVTIDGYTQDGAFPNTLTQPDKTNANLKIELHGASATNYCYGLNVAANDVVIRGLVINNFEFCGSANSSSAPGIRLSGTGHRVAGNFIGTNADGTGSIRNARGVSLSGANDSTIGGTSAAARNLISGNVRSGVEVSGSSGNTIQGNLIGPDRNGQPLVDPSNAVDAGVEISSGTSNRILSNSIFSNYRLGINLDGGTEDANDVTANDPKDPDMGPNRLQNYPLITSATTFGSFTSINGTLDSTPSTRKTKRTFTIQFFSNPSTDPNEGKTFLGEKQVTTNRQGKASFSFAPAQKVSEGQFITATATNNKTGDTSEFSLAKRVEEPVIDPG